MEKEYNKCFVNENMFDHDDKMYVRKKDVSKLKVKKYSLKHGDNYSPNCRSRC